MGRYYGSEALRNPKLQKIAVNFALDGLEKSQNQKVDGLRQVINIWDLIIHLMNN